VTVHPRITPLAFLVSMLFAAASSAAPPPGVPELYSAPLPKLGDRAMRDFPGVSMYGDIIYAALEGFRPLELDLYLPTKPSAAPRPLVIWIHGGGFEVGNPRADWTWGDWPPVLARLAARGYAVAGVTYRLSGEAAFPAQLEDVESALVFLRKNAALWDIDPRRVYAWGLSAGGLLAALVGAKSDEASADKKVQGVVDWFGPSDLAAHHADGADDADSRWLHCPHGHCTASAMHDASPVSWVTRQMPPTLIVHGEADRLVPIEQGQELYDRIHSAGGRVTIVRLPGLGHGFSGAGRAQLDDILDTTFRFFDSLTKSP
jgi:acetyl esterase/lipase